VRVRPSVTVGGVSIKTEEVNSAGCRGSMAMTASPALYRGSATCLSDTTFVVFQWALLGTTIQTPGLFVQETSILLLVGVDVWSRLC